MKFIAVVTDKDKIDQVVKSLEALGCTIEKVLRLTGVITGDAGPRKIEELNLPGILSVEPDRKISIRKKRPN